MNNSGRLAGIAGIIGLILVMVLVSQGQSSDQTSSPGRADEKTVADREIVAENLEAPWAIALLPDGRMLVTERNGRVRMVDTEGNLKSESVAVIDRVEERGEGGLLGITIHPEFNDNNFVYLYYTYRENGSYYNRVVRMKLDNQRLTDENVIVDRIPGGTNHNGGRIKFGPDENLYITTGDARNEQLAQNLDSLAGKILRVKDDGSPADGNPFGNLIYSLGHRNVQGLAWDSQDRLWATEHGRSGVLSGLDEINIIEAGKNYGWPVIQGDEQREEMETPKRHSGETTTWAPSGAVVIGNSLFFGGLRGQSLYEAKIENEEIVEIRQHLEGEYGRIREVVADEKGNLLLTTSNRDGRGRPIEADDRIIRLNPESL